MGFFNKKWTLPMLLAAEITVAGGLAARILPVKTEVIYQNSLRNVQNVEHELSGFPYTEPSFLFFTVEHDEKIDIHFMQYPRWLYPNLKKLDDGDTLIESIEEKYTLWDKIRKHFKGESRPTYGPWLNFYIKKGLDYDSLDSDLETIFI